MSLFVLAAILLAFLSFATPTYVHPLVEDAGTDVDAGEDTPAPAPVVDAGDDIPPIAPASHTDPHPLIDTGEPEPAADTPDPEPAEDIQTTPPDDEIPPPPEQKYRIRGADGREYEVDEAAYAAITAHEQRSRQLEAELAELRAGRAAPPPGGRKTEAVEDANLTPEEIENRRIVRTIEETSAAVSSLREENQLRDIRSHNIGVLVPAVERAIDDYFKRDKLFEMYPEVGPEVRNRIMGTLRSNIEASPKVAFGVDPTLNAVRSEISRIGREIVKNSHRFTRRQSQERAAAAAKSVPPAGGLANTPAKPARPDYANPQAMKAHMEQVRQRYVKSTK